MSFKDVLVSLAIIALAGWLLFRLAAFALARWLAVHQNLTIGQLGLLSVANVGWQQALAPLQLQSTMNSLFKHLDPAASASISAAVMTSTASSSRCLKAQVRLSIGSIQLKIHWNAFRGRRPTATSTTDSARASAPASLHAFTLIVDRVDVTVNIADTEDGCPVSSAPKSPQASKSSRRSHRNTGMFRMLFAMQLKTLLLQFIMYTLVRWLDVLISRLRVRLVTVQPSPQRQPVPATASAPPPPGTKTSTIEYMQDSLHFSGDLKGSGLGLTEPGSPRGSTMSLATGVSSALGGGATTPNTIDVTVTFSPISLVVNSIPIVSLLQSSTLTVSFAVTRPVPSFQRPSVEFAISPVSINAPPALAFWADHQSLLDAIKAAQASMRTAPSLATASSQSSPSLAQRLRKLGVHMHPLTPNVMRIICSRVQVEAPWDLGGTIQGISLVCSFGSAWWDTTAVLTTTEWSVTHAKEVVETLASLETDVTITLPDSSATATNLGGNGGSSNGSSSIRSREGTANRASMAANALSQKPLVQVELKAGGLEARVKESLITAVLAHLAAAAATAKASSMASTLYPETLSASGTTPTTPLLSPAPMSSRSPRASPFTLPALARRISRHASLNGSSSRSRRLAASDGVHEVKPLIPLAVRELLGLVDMEVSVSFHAVDIVVSPMPGVDICGSTDQLSVRACFAAVPKLEVDVSFSMDALCIRVMGGNETETQPRADYSVWLLASVDILRWDGLVTEVEHVPTHVHSATAAMPPAAGEASLLDPWETQRFDVVMEGHAHHPHFALSATQHLAACLAHVTTFLKKQHPTSPVSTTAPSRSMSLSVDPPSRPLIALHTTAKFTINRLSMSVSGEHRPDLPRTMSAEPGIDGSIDCLMVTHLGKRILGGGSSLAALLAVQALEVPLADALTGAMDTLHACRVDEMVVELDGVHFQRNQHCDVKPPPRYHGRHGAASAGGSPTAKQEVDPLLVASRVSFEHKVVDTAVQASSDMYPRLHRNVSTSVNVDEELIAAYSIPVHLLVEQLMLLAATMSTKSPMTPPPEPKRPSITSLTGSLVEAQRAQATAGLVSFVFELPNETKLKFQLSEIKAIMERHDNELYAQSNFSSIAVLATQSASTRTAQQTHASVFLGGSDHLPMPAWRLDPKQFAPLVNVSAVEIVRKPNQEIGATIEHFHVSVPHEYYFKDVIENFATFVKAIKPAKPPAGTTRTETMVYPTMRLEVKTLLFTVDDDPFDARLNQIFRNGKDQQRSRLEREKLLFNKLKTVPDLDHSPFWRELDAFHGREWIRIMSSANQEPLDKLLVLKLTEVDVVVTSPTLPLPTLAANCNLHDKDTPSDAQFDFELARDLSFQFRSLLVRLRDYPLPVIALPPPVDRKQSHMLHGLVILAEPIAPASSVCEVIVPVSTFGPQPFIHLRKVLSPIKVYSCLTWRLESRMTIHWGPALEAGLADAVRAIDQFTDPSLDPSEPMPWWDKIRWLLHGKLDIEGEVLKLHLLGTRNPYYSLFTSDGSHGIVVSAYGKRRMLPATFPGLPSAKVNSDSLPFERPFRLSFSSSNPGLLQCAQLEVAIVQPLINHNAAPRRPTDDIVAIPWDVGPVDKEVIMNLTGEVMLSLDPVFECAGTPPSHHHVFAVAPENVKEAPFHDSFSRFRSHRLSLAVHIRCDRTEDPSQFATFAFTPASIDYAIKFVQFNVITKTTPLRRGQLFPLTTPKYASKKLGLFTSRFALRVDLAPLLITLWHKNKAIQRPSDAVGMRAVVDRCLIDFHTARFRSTDATNATPPWYIDTTEIDFFGVELRCIILSDTSNNDGSGPYARFEQREQVFVRLANSHASLSVKSSPFFWSPKLSYCRNSDVDYGRESSFGRDINRVQLQLLKQYLASDAVAPTAKPAIQHRIRQLEQSDVYHLDQDDYVHSYVIHNSRLLWNVDIRNVVFKFIELQEQAFLLSYYTSNASLRIMRDLRELLEFRDEARIEQEQTALGDDRPATPLPFKPVLESLARRASSGAVLRVSTTDLTQNAPGSTKDSQRILAELLEGAGSVFVSEEDVSTRPAANQQSAATPETAHSTSSRNRAADLVIKSIMIQFINPQIKLCTVPLDDSPDGSCIVTTENTILTQNEIHRRGIMIKTKTAVNISDANFTVSAQRESAQQLGLGAPYLSDLCPGWLPLEFFFPAGSVDPTVAHVPTLPQGFCQVVHRAETRLQYQRLNPAISDKGVDDMADNGNGDDGLENDQNSWQLEFNRFLIRADPLAFSVLFNIFGKLLIYREPAKTRRQEQLDLLMLAAQADDIRVLLDSILLLRSDISQLQLALLYDASVLQDGQVDVDGTQRWITVLAQLAEMEDQLLVVMDSFKLLSSSSQQRVRGPGGLARSKSTSRSTSNSNISGSGGGFESNNPLNQSRSSNARVIHETIIKATQIEWHMLTLDGQSPFVQWMLAGVDFSLLDFSDQSRTFNLSIQQIFGRNMLPNPIYEEVANLFYVPAFYPPPPSASTDMDGITQGGIMPTLPLMIQVCWHELAPVAGISLVGLFELRLSPIKFQMTYELGKHLLNYVFPVKMPARESGSGHGSLAPSTSTLSLAKSSSIVGGGGRDGLSAGTGRKRSRGDLQRSGSTDALSQMKTRASRNTTFVRIRMPSVALCISYRGNKDKNIEDIHEFVLTLPTMEYHNKTWTWLEFLTQVRRDVFFAVLSHTGQLVKEKLFSSRRPLPQVPQHLSPHALPTLSVVPSTPSDAPMGFGHFPIHDSPRATLMPGPPTASRSRHSRSASEGGQAPAGGIKPSPSTTSFESSSAVTSPNVGKRKSQKSPKNKLFGGLMGKKSGSNTDLPEEELKRKMLFG